MLKKFRHSVFLKLRQMKFSPKEPIFIVGCGHSGTSILLSILSYHPDIYGIPNETYMFMEAPLNYVMIEEYFEKAGTMRLLEKTPKHVTKIDLITRVFPKAKIIVMIRDGRDVACSLKNRSGSFEDGIDRWVNDNMAWLSFKDRKNIHSVKLEDLVSNKEQVINQVFKFLDIKPSKDIFDYHTEKREFFNSNWNTEKITEHTINRNDQVNSPLKKDTSRWKDEMTPEEKELFKLKGNHLLVKFNYETSTNW